MECSILMQTWLFRSEPGVFSWNALVVRGSTWVDWTRGWNGVQNFWARSGCVCAIEDEDLGFPCHSNDGYLTEIGCIKANLKFSSVALARILVCRFS